MGDMRSNLRTAAYTIGKIRYPIIIIKYKELVKRRGIVGPILLHRVKVIDSSTPCKGRGTADMGSWDLETPSALPFTASRYEYLPTLGTRTTSQ